VSYTDLLNLALGNLGTLVVLILLVVAFQREWITTGTQLTRERERTDRVDAQADKMLDIQNQSLARLNLADEKEKWRREGQ
jgi:hypothetical protein